MIKECCGPLASVLTRNPLEERPLAEGPNKIIAPPREQGDLWNVESG